MGFFQIGFLQKQRFLIQSSPDFLLQSDIVACDSFQLIGTFSQLLCLLQILFYHFTCFIHICQAVHGT